MFSSCSPVSAKPRSKSLVGPISTEAHYNQFTTEVALPLQNNARRTPTDHQSNQILVQKHTGEPGHVSPVRSPPLRARSRNRIGCSQIITSDAVTAVAVCMASGLRYQMLRKP